MEKQSGGRQSVESSSLEIRLFGDFQVEVNGIPLPALRTRKGQWLLALLALRHDRETPRDWLAGTLWPDSNDSIALANLRRSLNDLRHALGSEARRILAPSPRSLRIDLSDAFCDVHEFDTALQRGDPASLETALSLYRGPLLEACPELWSGPERERREQSYLSALQKLADHAAQQGRNEDAIPFLRRILQVNPLLEAAQVALMEAFAAIGEPAEALRVYREFRLLLRREINAEPDSRATALYRRLRSETGRGHSRIGFAGVDYSGIQADPQQTPDKLNTQYPTPTSRDLNTRKPSSPALVGREREIADIIAHLDSARLLTLTGIGGMGKTRLALAVMREVAEDYPGGVWFVSLGEISEAERILEKVRETLGLPSVNFVEPLEQISARLEGCPALFILDNFEQLLPRGNQVLRALLETLPALTLLVTSRHRLNLSEEWEVPVPPLPLPDPAALPLNPEAALKFPGVELFVARARMRNPAFRLTPDNIATVTALCATLEGIPLATELAAAWAQMLTPGQMRARLSRRFDLLKSRHEDAPARHRSLYAALEGSYRLLAPEVQRFFARLAVFRGGWTLESAEAVCRNGEALDRLAELRDASLVLVEEGTEEMRYRFLETVREFAAEQQTEAERKETEQRHVAYFLHLAEEAAPHFAGEEQTAWLDRLERENDNLRAALDRCAWSDREQSLWGLRLAILLHAFWDRRGYMSEGRSRLVTMLEAAGEGVEAAIRFAALRAIGGLSHRVGDYIQAETTLKEALRLARERQDQEGEAIALASLGEVKGNSGDIPGARELLEQALQKHRERGDRQREAEALGFLGYLARSQGDFPTARALTEEALEIQRALGNRHGISWNLGSLGFVAFGEGNFEEARRLLLQALALNRELGNRSGQAWTLTSLAHMVRAQGDFAAACAYLEQAVAHYREQNEIGGTGWALFEMGATLFQQEQWEKAQATLRESQYLLNLCGDRKLAANVAALLDKLAEKI